MSPTGASSDPKLCVPSAGADRDIRRPMPIVRSAAGSVAARGRLKDTVDKPPGPGDGGGRGGSV